MGIYTDAVVAGQLSISVDILGCIGFSHEPKKAWPHIQTHALEDLLPWEERNNIL